MITVPPEAKYYEMQIHTLTEERDLYKAKNKVLEDENRRLKAKFSKLKEFISEQEDKQ